MISLNFFLIITYTHLEFIEEWKGNSFYVMCCPDFFSSISFTYTQRDETSVSKHTKELFYYQVKYSRYQPSNLICIHIGLRSKE